MSPGDAGVVANGEVTGELVTRGPVVTGGAGGGVAAVAVEGTCEGGATTPAPLDTGEVVVLDVGAFVTVEDPQPATPTSTAATSSNRFIRMFTRRD